MDAPKTKTLIERMVDAAKRELADAEHHERKIVGAGRRERRAAQATVRRARRRLGRRLIAARALA